MLTDERKQHETPATTGRRTGVGYPTMALGEAAAAIKELGKYGKTHKLPSLAGHLGHTTTNSGPFKRKLAALRDWGVISGKGDEISITQVGLAIALPDGELEERRALRQAFFNASVFAQTYESLVKNRSLSLEAIGNNAVRNFGIAATSREDFVKSFAASAVTAGLADRPDSANVLLHPVDSQTTSEDRSPVAAPDPVTPLGGAKAVSLSSSAPALRQVWAGGDVQIVFEIWGEPALTAGQFGQIGAIASEIEKLAAALRDV